MEDPKPEPTSCEDLPICPWCGYKETDPWDYKDYVETWCNSCDKPIIINRNHYVTYDCSPRDEAPPLS